MRPTRRLLLPARELWAEAVQFECAEKSQGLSVIWRQDLLMDWMWEKEESGIRSGCQVLT